MMDDARLAAQLCAIDPGLGGMIIRGGDPETRAALVTVMAGGRPVRKLPVHIDGERLLGGLDLAATLAAERPVARKGLLAEADGGVVVVPMAERLGAGTASQMSAAMDTGEIVTERDGMHGRDPARFTLALFDDGVGDETAPAVLAERLAFMVDLRSCPWESGSLDSQNIFLSAELMPSRERECRVSDAHLNAIASAAAAFGVQSARGSLLALRSAKALAALDHRDALSDADIVTAVRLVLVPRATQMPMPPEEAPQPEATPPPANAETKPLEDVVLDAVHATLPTDLIAAIAERGRRSAIAKGRGTGAKLRAQLRGRPVGVRQGVPRGGNRLSLIETLRAAAPWQKLRRAADDNRVHIRRDDLRIKRFQSRAETTTIFVVDASGSAAAARLAEAKGAVERLLADAYVKRAQVALIAFRGAGAELLLPPTRSLARARRSLAELPGGGGTPLAAGLAMAGEVAAAVRAKDRTPYVVLLTDGRGNVALDGSTDAAAASADAEAAAKRLNAPAVLIDISARPRADGAALTRAMGGRFVALPRGDAAALSAVVRAP